MARSSDHRIRHLARWVATPTLLLAAGAVFYAAYQRDVVILIGAAVTALVAGVMAVVVFDVELVRSRRAHGADRVAQARAYAAMYAAHVRVMAEGFALANPEVQAQRAREAVAAAVAADDASLGTPIVTDTPPLPAARVGEIVDTPPATVMAASALASAPGGQAVRADPAVLVDRAVVVDQALRESPEGQDGTPTDAVPLTAAASEASEGRPSETDSSETGPSQTDPSQTDSGETDSGETDQPEQWDNREAPTVVDLKAWEVRARVAAELEREERERQARDADEDATSTDELAADLHAGAGQHPKRSRFRRAKAKVRRKGA